MNLLLKILVAKSAMTSTVTKIHPSLTHLFRHGGAKVARFRGFSCLDMLLLWVPSIKPATVVLTELTDFGD